MATTIIVKLLSLNLALIHLNAIVGYHALPYCVKRYARPTTNHDRVVKVGRVSIAALVGLYTFLALLFHSLENVAFAVALALYICLDLALAVKMYVEGRKKTQA